MPDYNPNENATSCDVDALHAAADLAGNAFEMLKAARRLAEKAEEVCNDPDATDEDGNPHPETLAALYGERGLFPRAGHLRDRAAADLAKAADLLRTLYAAAE